MKVRINSNLAFNTLYNEGNYKGSSSKGWKSETFLRVLEQSTLGCVEMLGYHEARYHPISIDALRFALRFDSSAEYWQNRIGPPAIKTHSRITAE